MALVLMAKAFKLNNTTPTNNNQRSSSYPCNRQIAQLGINMNHDKQMLMVEDNVGNHFRPNKTTNQSRSGNVVAARARGNGNGNNENQISHSCRLLKKKEAGIQLNSEKFDFMAATGAYKEIEEVNANCTLKENLQQASTSGTQIDNAPVYDLDGSSEVHHSENCYNNDIFNMFTQEEQYIYICLLEPINEPHTVQQNNSNVISVESSVEHNGGTIEQHRVTDEEARAYFESLNNNLVIEVEKVNMVNRKMKETNADLTTELARYKNQEKYFEINQEKYDKLERYIHNWSSTAHQELHKIVKDEIFPIVNQVDARVQNFKIQFLKEAAEFVRDFKSLAKEADASLDKHKALEFEIERLLRAVVCQDIMSIVQNNFVVDTSNLQTKLDRTKEKLETCIIKKEKECDVLWNNWYKNVSLFPRLLSQMLCQKPVTSNSEPSTRESKVVNNDKVIASGMFRINPTINSRVDNFVPNKHVKASVRTKPITVSNPHVITKKDVNSDSNGLSSIGVNNIAKTRRPQPRRNTKNDRVPSASKSSCIENKEVEVEEQHRNLLLSKNKKHMSFECNNIKLAIYNDKSKVV
ncbi:hypothetical protein Tco_0894918 [Tanacetum coccineum]|uniref:Uncharacterized protein n=1 Tax=Tanacetum coccineum TaxID=301880 RepID=A0ABQ5CD14_9ASTR